MSVCGVVEAMPGRRKGRSSEALALSSVWCWRVARDNCVGGLVKMYLDVDDHDDHDAMSVVPLMNIDFRLTYQALDGLIHQRPWHSEAD